MDLHEYQAKELLRQAGVWVPPFGVVSKVEEVDCVVQQLGLEQAVIKIQVHAGGRGKAGGVQFARTPAEIKTVCNRLLGMKMVNRQTGPLGIVAHKLLITPAIEIERQYYLGAVVDRSRGEAVLLGSSQGGVEIEEIALKCPDQIVTVPIGGDGSVKPYHLLYFAKCMGWEGRSKEEGIRIASLVARFFVDTDASLLEINPLARTKEGLLWAVDAKLSIDDNALYRQPKMRSLYDPTQVSSVEVEAKGHDLAYIPLDGNIGCMVNGAGLAMATMDLIQSAGGRAANFLDVGGSATAEKIAAGFSLLNRDQNVKALLVNIFGGIMSCITIAQGILLAVKQLKVRLPLVVRMEGTDVKEGKKMLHDLDIQTADELGEAARIVVQEAHAHSHS